MYARAGGNKRGVRELVILFLLCARVCVSYGVARRTAKAWLSTRTQLAVEAVARVQVAELCREHANRHFPKRGMPPCRRAPSVDAREEEHSH